MDKQQTTNAEVRSLGNKYFRAFMREHAEMVLGPILGVLAGLFFYLTCNPSSEIWRIVGTGVALVVSAIWLSWIIGQALAADELEGRGFAVQYSFGLGVLYLVVYLVAISLYKGNLCLITNPGVQNAEEGNTTTAQMYEVEATATDAPDETDTIADAKITPTPSSVEQIDELITSYLGLLSETKPDNDLTPYALELTTFNFQRFVQENYSPDGFFRYWRNLEVSDIDTFVPVFSNPEYAIVMTQAVFWVGSEGDGYYDDRDLYICVEKIDDIWLIDCYDDDGVEQ